MYALSKDDVHCMPLRCVTRSRVCTQVSEPIVKGDRSPKVKIQMRTDPGYFADARPDDGLETRPQVLMLIRDTSSAQSGVSHRDNIPSVGNHRSETIRQLNSSDHGTELGPVAELQPPLQWTRN